MIAELEDGAVIVELGFAGVDWLVREVLKEAGDAVVLEPEDARAAVRAAAEAIGAAAGARRRGEPPRPDRLTAEEQAGVPRRAARTVICATNGARGWPHLMPLWYVVRDGEMWAWTYGQVPEGPQPRARPARDAAGRGRARRYDQLRGVMIEAQTVLHREPELVSGLGVELLARYGGGASTPEIEDAVRAQAPKRVALQFMPERIASWDHRKLAGAY